MRSPKKKKKRRGGVITKNGSLNLDSQNSPNVEVMKVSLIQQNRLSMHRKRGIKMGLQCPINQMEDMFQNEKKKRLKLSLFTLSFFLQSTSDPQYFFGSFSKTYPCKCVFYQRSRTNMRDWAKGFIKGIRHYAIVGARSL